MRPNPLPWLVVGGLLGAGCDDGLDHANDTETAGSTAADTDAGETPDDGPAGDETGEPDDGTDAGSDGTDDDGSPDDGSDDGDPPSDCVPPPIECGPETPVIGTPNATTRDAYPIQWADVPGCEVAMGQVRAFVVPDDIVSLSITLDHGSGWTAIDWMTLDGEVLIDSTTDGYGGWGQPPTKHLPNIAASTVMPMSEGTFAEPGCLVLWPSSDGDPAEDGELSIVSRRAEELGDSVLDIDLIVLDGADIEVPELQAVVDVVIDVYESNDAALIGNVDAYALPADSPYVSAEGPELEAMRATAVSDNPNALKVFFVADVLDAPGTLGFAAGVPGPNGVDGTGGSGVVLSVESHRSLDGELLLSVMGETLAHELGHQLGLFHTTENDGTDNDLAPDTAECGPDDDTDRDGQLMPSECPDGSNLMFWTTDGAPQTELSPFQSDVIFLSPVMG